MPAKSKTDHSGVEREAGRQANGRFGANNPGRPPGIKDSRAASKEAILQVLEAGDATRNLPSGLNRLIALAIDPDPNIRLGFERFRFDHSYGKARESVDVFHRFQAIDEANEMMNDDIWQGRDVPNLPAKRKRDGTSGDNRVQ